MEGKKLPSNYFTSSADKETLIKYVYEAIPNYFTNLFQDAFALLNDVEGLAIRHSWSNKLERVEFTRYFRRKYAC